MCDKDIKQALENSHASDLETQGKGIAECMGALDKVLAHLEQIPTRHEVREMIGEAMKIHVNTCDAARDDGRAPETNKFKLGLAKFGLEAEGKSGVMLGALIGLALAWLVWGVAPRITEWLGAFFGR